MTSYHDLEKRAARWVIRREEPLWSEADEADLQSWLDESFANKAAFWRLQHGWQKAGHIVAAGSDNETHRGERGHYLLWEGLGPRVSLAAVAAMVALVLVGLLMLVRPTSPDARTFAEFQTDIGERKTLALSEGSIVELNTDSDVRTNVSDDQRDVWLDKGEAYFEVAQMRDTPFVVHAGPQTVKVLGTKFVVRHIDGEISVFVVEGRVAIGDNAGRRFSNYSILGAGEAAVSRGRSTTIMRNAHKLVGRSTAWRDGKLVFDNTPLSEAMKEFSRYNRKPVMFGDRGVSEIRVGGSFKAGNIDAFLHLLEAAYGIRVEERDEHVIISSP